MNIKDIHKAACLYADSVEADYTKDGQNYFRGYANEMKDLVRQSFFTGARWYEHDFINLLWHGASEKPKRSDIHLVLTHKGCLDLCWFDRGKWDEPMLGGGDVAMWLDLNDLRPRKEVENESNRT